MALRSLERCQVALLVIDASEGSTAQDAHIAGYAHEAGRAAVIVVNKWDLVPPRMVRRAEVVEQIRGAAALHRLRHGVLHRGRARRGHRRSVHRDRPRAARRRRAPRLGQRADHHACGRRSSGGRPRCVASRSRCSPPRRSAWDRRPSRCAVNWPDQIHFSYERVPDAVAPARLRLRGLADPTLPAAGDRSPSAAEARR